MNVKIARMKSPVASQRRKNTRKSTRGFPERALNSTRVVKWKMKMRYTIVIGT